MESNNHRVFYWKSARDRRNTLGGGDAYVWI